MILTREQIEKLQARKEIDRLIASVIFGKKVNPIWIEASPVLIMRPGQIYHEESHWEYPHTEDYSTEISAAWEVAEKLKQFSLVKIITGGWGVMVWSNKIPKIEDHQGGLIQVKAETAPLAICRAALISKL